uniref:(California timema) hypothetical protein n=1 Tax=Timema californicum TaxID=61474 RepID=A0A7R9JG52_TIMCA|nr:unnamed protein product [Timema californicum]
MCGASQKPLPVPSLPCARTVFNVRCLTETFSCAIPALCQGCVQCAKPLPVLSLPSVRTVFNVRYLTETSSCAILALCKDCVQCAVPHRNLFLCYPCPVPGPCSMCGTSQKPLPVLSRPSACPASNV